MKNGLWREKLTYCRPAHTIFLGGRLFAPLIPEKGATNMKLVKKSHEEIETREMSVDSSFFADWAAFAAW